jgi:hypothetical protein
MTTVTVSRWTIAFLILTVVAAATVAMLWRPSRGIAAPPPTPALSRDEAGDVLRVARELIVAFGTGELYRSPEGHPLTNALAQAIRNRQTATWPAFEGTTGEVLVVLRGTEAGGRDFVDVTGHVLNKTLGGTGLTQVTLRMVREGGTWKADRLDTTSKGDVLP